MKFICFLIMLILPFNLLKAQSDSYRYVKSVPIYGLKKVQRLINRLGEDYPTTKDMDSLSLREKFTYHMIHQEFYFQICYFTSIRKNVDKKIYAYLERDQGDPNIGCTWGDNQLSFFKENKDTVLKLIKESSYPNLKMGMNFKYVIVHLNATEMIPLLIKAGKSHPADHDFLTVLTLLMDSNKYQPFLKTRLRKELYDDTTYNTFVNYTPEKEEEIITLAQNFYKSIKNK